MSQEQEPPPRIVDKRGQGSRASVPTEPVVPLDDATRAALEEAMADQGRAADEAGPEPFRCSSVVLITLDHGGAMRLVYDVDQIAMLAAGGVTPDRQATPADLTNMAGQFQMMVMENGVASRVMAALAQQAQQAIMDRLPQNGLSVPGGRNQR